MALFETDVTSVTGEKLVEFSNLYRLSDYKPAPTGYKSKEVKAIC